MVLTGTVKNITDYGAFIDLGGIDGLLHGTDMSQGPVGHPSEIFQVGDQVEVVVLHFDRESGRVSLGYKQKSNDPWETVETRFAPGTKTHGRVVSLTNYGAFVELEPGVEGLVHVSEMSWTRRVRHPSKLVNVGDEVEVIVLDVNRGAKRISLGMKQVEPDPWTTIEERYKPGTRVSGKVRNLTDFGAFIELTLLVIRVDPHERRIGLSLKELAQAVAPPEVDDRGAGGAGRRGKRGKSRDYDYDDEE